VLTQLSNFWFRKTDKIVPNHLVSTDLRRFPKAFKDARSLAGRAVLVQHCERIDIECVARGYISGSAWTEYKALGTVAGEELPKALIESEQLAEPIFTPATKAESGHDQNISRAQLAGMIGHRAREGARAPHARPTATPTTTRRRRGSSSPTRSSSSACTTVTSR